MDICFNLLFTHPCQWEAAVIFAYYILHAVNLFLINQFDFLRFRNFCAAIKLHRWFWPLLIAFINFFPNPLIFFALFLFRCVLVIIQPSCKHLNIDNTGFILGCHFHFYYHNLLKPLYMIFFFAIWMSDCLISGLHSLFDLTFAKNLLLYWSKFWTHQQHNVYNVINCG